MPRRPRVLDLTRVVAGPVASRTLAHLGCDVLRVDPARLRPEIEAQHVDTGAGKRSTLLDLHDPHARDTSHGLLETADVLLTGYRPGALTTSAWSRSCWPRGIRPWSTRPSPRGRRAAHGAGAAVSTASCRPRPASPVSSRPTGTDRARCRRRCGPRDRLSARGGVLLRSVNGVRQVAPGAWRPTSPAPRTGCGTDALDGRAAPLTDPTAWLVETATDSGVVVQPRPAFRIDDWLQRFAPGGLALGRGRAGGLAESDPG